MTVTTEEDGAPNTVSVYPATLPFALLETPSEDTWKKGEVPDAEREELRTQDRRLKKRMSLMRRKNKRWISHVSFR